MKVEFSIVANTLEEAKGKAQEEVKKFSGTEESLKAVRAEPYDTIYETKATGEATSWVVSWEVFFECDV